MARPGVTVYEGSDDRGTRFRVAPKDSREALLAQRMECDGKSREEIAYTLMQLRQIEGETR